MWLWVTVPQIRILYLRTHCVAAFLPRNVWWACLPTFQASPLPGPKPSPSLPHLTITAPHSLPRAPFSWVRFTVQETLTSATSKAGIRQSSEQIEWKLVGKDLHIVTAIWENDLVKFKNSVKLLVKPLDKRAAETHRAGQWHTQEGFLCLEGTNLPAVSSCPERAEQGTGKTESPSDSSAYLMYWVQTS